MAAIIERAHAAGPRIVVVKRGPEGSKVSADGRVLDQPAISVAATSVREAVGAGDAFDAGFLDSLARGGSAAEGARQGTAVAALSLIARGGADGILDRAMVDRARKDVPEARVESP
jgi:sugar/nucleoside kinase (ribokinase family)